MDDTRLGPAELLAELTWLRGLARALVRDAAAADDLAQEGVAAALARPPRVDEPVRPWLAATLRNLARFGRRTGMRRARREALSVDAFVEEITPERLVGRLQLERLVAGLVLALEEPYRTTLLLRYRDERTSTEIAREQGVPAATVRWRLAEGLSRLRAALTKAGVQMDERWMALWLPAGRARRLGPWALAVGVVGLVALVVSFAVGGRAASVRRAALLPMPAARARASAARKDAARGVAHAAGPASAGATRFAVPPPRFTVAAGETARMFQVRVEISSKKDGLLATPTIGTAENVAGTMELESKGWRLKVVVKPTPAADPACETIALMVGSQRPEADGTTLKREAKTVLEWCGQEQISVPPDDDTRLMGGWRFVVSVRGPG